MTTWAVKDIRTTNTPRIKVLLAQGWEPFAVVPEVWSPRGYISKSERLWLRRDGEAKTP